MAVSRAPPEPNGTNHVFYILNSVESFGKQRPVGRRGVSEGPLVGSAVPRLGVRTPLYPTPRACSRNRVEPSFPPPPAQLRARPHLLPRLQLLLPRGRQQRQMPLPRHRAGLTGRDYELHPDCGADHCPLLGSAGSYPAQPPSLWRYYLSMAMCLVAPRSPKMACRITCTCVKTPAFIQYTDRCAQLQPRI